MIHPIISLSYLCFEESFFLPCNFEQCLQDRERERKREWRSAKALRVVADVLVEWEKSRIFHTMSMILHFIFLPQGKISGKILDDILLLNDDDNEKKK